MLLDRRVRWLGVGALADRSRRWHVSLLLVGRAQTSQPVPIEEAAPAGEATLAATTDTLSAVEDLRAKIFRATNRRRAAGAPGLALNLASLDEMGAVGRIELLQGAASEWTPLDTLTPSGQGPLVPPMSTLIMLGGRKEKIRPGDVLGALTADLGYTREQIGKIDVNEFSTYVAVDRGIAHDAERRLNDGRIKGKSVKVRLLE